ncbi:MAG: hypothetical protein N2440_02525 [Actinobacteria bacterium]|nr:hypothetical protein [Actinomycetota bacterium]
MEKTAITSCFVHSLAGVFSVLFFLLASSSGATALIVMKKFKEDDPIYKAVEVRLKFGVAYIMIATLLLLLAIVLGVGKSGAMNIKFLTSFLLLIYSTSIPFVSNLKSKKNYIRLSYLLLFSGLLSILNLLVGNVFFTSFHNYL